MKKTAKIFVVDDDSFCLTLYRQFLIKLGYADVNCYTSGKDCLDNLTQHPEIVFLDYNMEEMNGIDVLLGIKRFDPAVTVIFISGQEDVAVAVDALKYGAADYIVKSKINLELLQETLNKIGASRQLIKGTNNKKSLFKRVKDNLGM